MPPPHSESRYQFWFLAEHEQDAEIATRIFNSASYKVIKVDNLKTFGLLREDFVFLSDDAAMEYGERLCRLARGLAEVYDCRYLRIRCYGYSRFDDGKFAERVGISEILTVSTATPAGLDALTIRLDDGETPASSILQAAYSDELLSLVLGLVSSPPITWRDVYDVMEAIGEQQIVQQGWMSVNRFRLLKRVANGHRHLGLPKLMRNLPSLEYNEARKDIHRVLRRFIVHRVAKAPILANAEKGI